MKNHRNSRKTHCFKGHPLFGPNLKLDIGYNKRPKRTCVKCRNERRRLRYANDPEFKRYVQNYDYLYRYGLTIEGYDLLLVKQNNRCAICGSERGKNRLHVDHNHITNKIRELLCGNCNTILGMSKDNITILLKAVAYLERHSEDSPRKFRYPRKPRRRRVKRNL